MKRHLITLVLSLWVVFGYSQTISSFPYQYAFENEAQGPTGCGPVYTMLEAGWENDATTSLNWTADVGGTASSGTGPSVDLNPGTATGIYMYLETSCSGTGYPSVTAGLLTPYFDLQQKISYKASSYGIRIEKINPRYTSQRCSKCGFIDQGNRINQADFKCLNCDLTLKADYNAARNIATLNIESLIDNQLKIKASEVRPSKSK